jgi:fructan beta-fructosidase
MFSRFTFNIYSFFKFAKMKRQKLIFLFIVFVAFACNVEQNADSSANDNLLHFTLEKIGEPVSLHFWNEEYHLFLNPAENHSAGIKHFKSKNLLSWQEVPTVFGEGNNTIKSACVIRDCNNELALDDVNEPLLAFSIKNKDEKAEHQTIELSYSKDLGTTWATFDGLLNFSNPIASLNDLKVFWHEETQRWIMLLLKYDQLEIYASNDLINWGFVNILDDEETVKKGNWTSLEFFSMETAESQQMKWCLCISTEVGSPNGGMGTQYFVGDFDGYQFYTHDDVKWMDNGTDFTAPIVLSDHLLVNKKPVCIAQINSGQSIPTLSLPRSLSLIKKYNEYFICSSRLQVLEQKKNKTKLLAEQEFSGELKIAKKQELPLEIKLTFDLNNRKSLDFAEVYGLILENEKQERIIVGYHNLHRYFFISFQNEQENIVEKIDYAPCIIDQTEVEFQLIVDNATVELFALDGLISMTKNYPSNSVFNQINLFTEGGKITLKEGSITQISKLVN